MNVNKEFVPIGENVIVSVGAINNGQAGSKTITVYSNKVPIGSAQLQLQSLEEKTVEIPVDLKNMGINKITVSDAPQLFRNVFVQEADASAIKGNQVLNRVTESPLKVSMVVVFLVFAGTLYYMRNKLKEEESPPKIPVEAIKENQPSNVVLDDTIMKRASYLREKLSDRMRAVMKNKPRP